MKLYLAARYERRIELAGYADQLRDLGHVVTSRWLAGNAELPVSAQVRMDLEDIDEADAVVSFTEAPGFVGNCPTCGQRYHGEGEEG